MFHFLISFQTKMNVPNQMAVVIKFVRIIQEVSAVRASMASCYNQTGKHAKVRAQIYSTSEQVLTRSQ